jgi:hypothetical protein
MTAEEEGGAAPPHVRGMGYYVIVLSLCYATFAGIVIGIHDEPSTYNLVGVIANLAIGTGLVLRRRWAYAAAVGFSAFAVLWQIKAFGYWLDNQGDTESLQRPFFVLTIVGVAVPLLLLRRDSRRWFLGRQL